MKSLFLTFFDPVFKYIDDGHLFRKPFYWIYGIIAIINLISPFLILFGSFKSWKYMDGRVIFAFILVWFFVALAFWIGFQLWWNRKDKVLVTSRKGSLFTATPVLAHFIQTTGEWYGLFVTIVGIGVGLMSPIAGNTSQLIRMTGFPVPGNMSGLGFLLIVAAPLLGLSIVMLSRVAAELINSLSAMANSLQRIDYKTKKQTSKPNKS